MSNFQQAHPLPSGLSSGPPSPDLHAIAAILHEAAQTLHSFGNTPEADVADVADAHGYNEECPDPIENAYARGEFHDELRCFRLPHYIVRQEYALLQQHKKESFFQLLDSVYDDFLATILLMRNLDDGAHFSGFQLHLISNNLSRPLDLLSCICSQLADFELVQKTIAPD
ncbi:hypothetical protein [Desulfovibrio intestinalis]|uniref:Uncharacterized protein n=1 Tax=Desulfovibrio intestinalis TaxID=58621 RepID=A0A7W8C2B8_9BACT|nr:hypothetical protein [Desulfovibrio intestinalis]MBB5143112.1 hypothetical protein [Desulfovibrio intestinalis]